MKLYKKWMQQLKQQHMEFKDSQKEIHQLNLTTLRRVTIIVTIVCAGMFALSLVLPSYTPFSPLYAGVFIAMGVFCWLSFKLPSTERRTLVCLYLLFFVLIIFTIYLSVFASPDYRATIFLGCFLAVPLLILDYNWRVNLFLIFAFLIHTILVFFYKADLLPVDDTVNAAVFLMLGFALGKNSRNTKLENFSLQRQTVALAQLDFLTGLHNRRKMYELMQESQENGAPITGVILFDIDHFKGYNDKYGHLAGDSCLSQVGTFLKEFGSQQKLSVFRFGGEEFIAFDYQRSFEDLSALSETLRTGICNLQIPYPHCQTGIVTASLGFCTAPIEGDYSVHTLISLADQALYSAKNKGRNCIVGLNGTAALFDQATSVPQ